MLLLCRREDDDFDKLDEDHAYTDIPTIRQKIVSTTDAEVWMLESKLKDRYLFKEKNGVSKYTMPLVCSVRVYVSSSS